VMGRLGAAAAVDSPARRTSRRRERIWSIRPQDVELSDIW
jgi:hypothetical protein